MVLHSPDPPTHSAQSPVVNLIVGEDNEAVITLVHKERTPAHRHLHRAHRINWDYINETCQQEHIQLKYVGTKIHVADMMAKHFEPKKVHLWQDLFKLSSVFPVAVKTAEKLEIARAASTVRGFLANGISRAVVLHAR
eukprot:4119332-Pyramimonas_sp.AAC.1